MNETATLSGLLDGAAGEVGPDNSWPADAAQFAARWNSEPEHYREVFVSRLATVSNTSFRCFAESHQEQIDELTKRNGELAAKPKLPLGLARAVSDVVDSAKALDIDRNAPRFVMAPVHQLVLMREQTVAAAAAALVTIEMLDARLAHPAVS